MSCTLEGCIHRTTDKLVMCDGEIHMTIYQPDPDMPATYTYAVCPDVQEPPVVPMTRTESVVMLGAIVAATALWVWVLVNTTTDAWGRMRGWF